MVKNILFSIAFLFFLLPIQHDVPSIEVTSPIDGQTVQGSVPIIGTISSIGYSSGAVYYTYDQAQDSSWFLVSDISQTVNNGTLAVWDTSTISDGDYQIKVEVKYQDGTVLTKIIKGLLVRNYTQAAIIVNPAVELGTSIISVTPQVTETQPEKIPTAFAPNSISIDDATINQGLVSGALIGGGLVLVVGIYVLINFLRYHR